MSAAKRRQGAGFSLVELMMALAVLATLLVLAAPAFRDTVRRHRVIAAGNALLADLAYARSEAILRGIVVSICASSNASSSYRRCDVRGKAYESGWMVYAAPSGGDRANWPVKPTGIPLRVGLPRDGVAIQALDGASLGFDAQGQLHAPGQPSPRFTVCFRPSASAAGISTAAVPGVELTVNASGRVTSRALGAQQSCAGHQAPRAPQNRRPFPGPPR